MYTIAVAAFLLMCQASALKWTDCGSKTGEIIDVRISGCEETDVCELKRGETYTYNLDFKSLTDSETLTAKVYGIVGGVAYPYPLPDSNVCNSEDVDCPVENGKTYNIETIFEMRQSYPPMRIDVKWVFKDDNNENLACGIVPAKIV